MNFCIITSTFPTNDADPLGGFILDFCLKLSQSNNVTVITQKRASQYQINNKLNLLTFDWSGKNIPLSDLKIYKISHLYHILSLFYNAKKTLKKFAISNKIDHCFALWAIPSGIASFYLYRKCKIPYDIWCLGSDIWKHQKNFFTKHLLGNILKNANHVYADGFLFCKDVERLSNKGCAFLPSSRNIPNKQINGKIKIKKTFIFIGRYHYNKGPDVLLKAISLLPKAIYENSEFVFYGTGTLKKQLKEILKKSNLNNVFINDIIDKNHIFEVLSLAHFIIIPSRIDSIPVILSDALQCNTPIIGADVEDLGSVIKKYKIGYTFEKENTLELSKAIINAFNDNKEDYFNNIQQALKIFSVENAVSTFINNLNNEE